jgi:hypothetical protein
MKTAMLSDSAMNKIDNQFQMIDVMVNGSAEVSVETVFSAFDKINTLVEANHPEVAIPLAKQLEEGIKISFPNFDISKYKLDVINDIITRGDGTVLSQSNSTNVEKTLLDAYNGVAENANDTAASILERADEWKNDILKG